MQIIEIEAIETMTTEQQATSNEKAVVNAETNTEASPAAALAADALHSGTNPSNGNADAGASNVPEGRNSANSNGDNNDAATDTSQEDAGGKNHGKKGGKNNRKNKNKNKNSYRPNARSSTNQTTTNHRQTHPDYSTLLPLTNLSSTVRAWIDDDMPSLDVGGLVVGATPKAAQLWMKSSGVFAGRPFFEAVFAELDGCEVTWTRLAQEGRYLKATDESKALLATVTGPCHQILRGERTALCALSRCSGVATTSRNSVQIARSHNWNGHVAGTRKTTPGFRIVEKYGLLVGGAATHRLDLSQMVMLKDNHVWSAGSIGKAVKLARRAAGFSQKIEVECRNLGEALEAAEAGADIVMLDNYQPAKLKEDAKALKEKFPHVLIEASGGITSETMGEYLSEHVDVVSQGNLTQGYPCLDFSLKIKR